MDTDVKLLAAMLSPGDTLRTVCPKCNGGASGESSFSITRDDEGLVYKCFRAKCNFSGGNGSKKPSMIRTTELSDREEEKRDRAKEIFARLHPPGEIREGILEAKFNYPVVPTLGCLEDPETGRICTPLYNRGKLVGFTSRRFYPHASPKAITYQLDPAAPMIGFWNNPWMVFPLLIVEDVFSAGAMTDLGMPTCALLGTSTSDEGWMDIAQFARRYTSGRAVIALDEDATDQAVRLCMSKRNMFCDLGMYVITGPDIKDMKPEQRMKIRDELKLKGR